MARQSSPLSKTLLKLWHPTKNGDITPDMVTAGSGRVFWWICDQGHEWKATPLNLKRTGNCPACSNKLLIPGSNDLLTLHPKLAAEWHPIKNNTLTPSGVMSGYTKKVWWMCDQGHEWEADVWRRVNKETGCPACAGQKTIVGKNDLTTTHPKLAEEYHPNKNTIQLNNLMAGTSKKVWWLGDCGHEWEATPEARVRSKTGCPYCAGQKVLTGFNDLAFTQPHLALQWDFQKNNILTPQTITAGSNRKVWWICVLGHEWEATVSQRSKRKTGCPVCSNRTVISGFNDLATVHPNLAKEWHPDNLLKPTEVAPRAGKIVKWMCLHGHVWSASVASRSGGSGCPVCANQTIAVGVNDLTTTHPLIAIEWHPKLNLPLTPQEVIAGSEKLIWLLGKCGHAWQTQVRNRTLDKTGCPYCAGQKVLTGFNDIATISPQLASEWHPTKNGILTPQKLTIGSNRKVWWQCEKGHAYNTTPHHRLRKQSCPFCSNHQILEGFNDLQSTHPELVTEWHPKNKKSTNQITAGSNLKFWWLCESGHEWEARPANRSAQQKTNCPICALSIYVSKAEQEVFNYIISLNIKAEQSNRNLIGSELDIFVPEKNIAIEFNGIYYHTEIFGRGKDFHKNKWLACKNKGVQLIQIWEDDWNRNPELVKRMLAHKLGVVQENKIFARKTFIKHLDQQTVDTFLLQNHIQGSVQGSIRLGLIVIDPATGEPGSSPSERLVAVMVLKKEPGTEGKTLNLLRFATSQPVVGGFTKLLKQVERIDGIEKIVTFSDNCVSDGGLYANTGFIAVKELEPDYMYVKSNRRYHKFNYRIKRFREDADLKYEEGLTERELAQLNNLPRIWDAGKTKWELVL